MKKALKSNTSTVPLLPARIRDLRMAEGGGKFYSDGVCHRNSQTAIRHNRIVFSEIKHYPGPLRNYCREARVGIVSMKARKRDFHPLIQKSAYLPLVYPAFDFEMNETEVCNGYQLVVAMFVE
mmetsp:Transcript_6908/g.19994  ORF Transcript_6908/g.19994 Transcript_6908/m.19994 type:complete len:123 (+) Transcript_6908:1901-2269(+)